MPQPADDAAQTPAPDKPGFLAWMLGYLVLLFPLKLLVDWADATWIEEVPFGWADRAIGAAGFAVVVSITMAAFQVFLARRARRRAARDGTDAAR